MFIAQCFHHLLTYHQTLIYTSRHEIRYMDTLSSFSATLRKGNNFCHCLFVFREGEVLQKRSRGANAFLQDCRLPPRRENKSPSEILHLILKVHQFTLSITPILQISVAFLFILRLFFLENLSVPEDNSLQGDNLEKS